MGKRIRSWIRRRAGVRMRSALAAAAVVAVASVLTGVALVIAAHLLLLGTVEQNARQRAGQVAAAVGQGGTAGLAAIIYPSPRERTVVQVLDPAGRVLAASPGVSASRPISPLRPSAGQTVVEHRRLAATHHEVFLVVAQYAEGPDGPRTVLVAQSLDEVDDGTAAVAVAILLGLPLLTVVVGAATFLYVGRTLRPVEAMRRQAATITTRSLHTRLPVPVAEDEISALAATMNTMLDRIESATLVQHRFVADASHELRSPLATIHAGLDLLAKADLPEPVDAHVHRMHRESTRMARLIDDLLLLARVDESGLRLRREDVDLDDLVYAERDRATAARPDLRIEARVSPTRVTGDAHHLQRALRNLVDNALHHAAHSIVLRVTTEDGYARVVVADDGPGIAQADRVRVFDRFMRLDEDRSRRGGGTGLGLAIARDIVQAHGGTLTIEGDQPGTIMAVRLPRD